MITLADLRPGDIMFGPMGGFFPGVVPVAVGQFVLAGKKGRESWRRWWNVRHVGVVTQAVNAQMLNPTLVEAMPGGAREIALTEKRWTKDFVYVRPPYAATGPWADSWGGQGKNVANIARRYIGTPYSFLDYVALALHAVDPVWRIAPEATNSQPLAQYIKSSGHMICSQLADRAMADAGYHVFNDGRLPQDVTPSELFMKLVDTPGTQYVVPTRSEDWVREA